MRSLEIIKTQERKMIKMPRMIKVVAIIFAIIFLSSCVSIQNSGYNIESIKRHSKKQIVLIQKELKEQKIMVEVTKRTNEIRDIFDKAEMLYKEGELVKAKELYEKAYKLADDKFITDHVKRVNKELSRQIQKDKK
jgi:hypothetical protein